MTQGNNKVNIKKLAIFAAVMPVLIIIACSIAIVITVSALPPAGETKTEIPAEETYAVTSPASAAEAENMAYTLIAKAAASGTVKSDTSAQAELSDIICENKALEKIIDNIKTQLAEQLTAGYKAKNGDYGEDASYLIRLFPQCSAESFTAEDDDENLILTLIFHELTGTDFEADDNSVFTAAFEKNKDIFTAKQVKTRLDRVVYSAVIDKRTAELKSAETKREYTISFFASFNGALGAINAGSFSCRCSLTEKAELNFAGIKIEQDKIILTEKADETLQITANVSKNAAESDFTLNFTSSAPDIVSVDSNGVLHALKASEENVTITAALTYLGETFTDSCTVNVQNSSKKNK